MKDIQHQKFLTNPLTYLIIFSTGVLMRILNINEGLWLDEIWSMATSSSQNSVSGIIEFCKTDTHPPLFDILLHLFLRLFGDNEINGRVLSLIIGCIGLPITLYYAVKVSKNRLVGFIAFSIITFSFFHTYYSGEGRFYSFLYLLSLVTICEMYIFLRDKKIINLLLYIISSVLIIYTHYYGAILLFALSLITLFLWIIKDINLKTFLHIIIANVIILFLYSPWIPYMFGSNKGTSWMSVPNFGSFFEYFYLYTGKNPVEFLFIFTSIFFSIKLFKTNVKFYSIMLGTIFLGFITPFIVSHLTVPMLHYRYTIIYYPCIIMLCASFLGETKIISQKIKTISFSVITISVLVNFFFINKFIQNGRSEPWREIAQDIAKLNKVSDEKVHAVLNFHLSYYLNKYGLESSTAYSKPEPQETFWYVQTSYEKTPQIIDKDLIVLEKKIYRKKFVLTHYQRN